MLTMAIEDPPRARPRPFIDGLLRVVAATGLMASVIGFGYLAVVASVGHVLFDEWQVIFAAVSLAAILVGLAIGSWFLLRSRRSGRGWASYLRLGALALVPGLLLGLFISAFIIGSLGSSWIRHSSFGDPNGPGVTTLKSAPAPTSFASLMLTPTDLGAGWYNKTKPNPSLMSSTTQAISDGQLVGVKNFIDSEHWTGHVWQDDGLTIEVLRHFDSAAHANTYTASWKTQNGVTLSPRTIGQTVVQQGVMAGNWRVASFTVGDNYFEVEEDNLYSLPTIAQFQTVLTAALAKATSTP
ncbi:MAG TPA: hypothetical protein VGL75_08395 [Acidothermaceae bacterium]|jgi:hypothetical protein